MVLKMTKVAEDIVEIKTDVKWIKQTLTGHMSDHAKVRMMMYGSILGALVAIVLSVVI